MSSNTGLRERVLNIFLCQRVQKSITIGAPLLWLLVLLFIPLLFLVTVSFASISDSYQIIWEFSLSNYAALFQAAGYHFWETPFVHAYLISLFIAFMTTVLSLLLALPLAYFLARCDGRTFKMIFYLVLVPFFTVYLVRVYSWHLLFGAKGVINNTLMTLGVINHPIAAFGYGQTAIIVALTHAFLPYMLFTLYASFDGLDFSLLEAAQDLGATRRETFQDIIIPLITPGIISGSIFVFIPSFGAFIAPQILAQGKVQMIGQLIGLRVNSLYAIGYGSAVAVLIILPIGIIFAIGYKYAAFNIIGGEE